MENTPNENLIITLPEIKLGDKDEKVSVSNIAKNLLAFKLEINKTQFKNLYLELKVDYRVTATIDNEDIYLKRLKIRNILKNDFQKIEKEVSDLNIKEINLTQEKAGKRSNWFIPVRFMIKIYAPNSKKTINENVELTDFYRKVFFREMMLKLQLKGSNFFVDLFDLDQIKFDTIEENDTTPRIIEIESFSKKVLGIADDFAKEIGYWVMAEKTILGGAKILGSLFKKKNKKSKG